MPRIAEVFVVSSAVEQLQKKTTSEGWSLVEEIILL